MKYILKIPLLGVITCLSISALAVKKNSRELPRTKRSFGFSNPIFSRVFNPYDNRPLAQKFFGNDYHPVPVHEDGPQYYPLWHSQPILNDEDSVEEYSWRENPGYVPLNRRIPQSTKPYPPPSKPYPAPSKPYSAATKPYPAPSRPHPVPSKPYPPPSTLPCPIPHPEQEKPHQPTWKPVIGRLFVDEVNKNLHFERDPETGNLVPVITEEKTNIENNNSNHSPDYQTERTHESIRESQPITTSNGEEELQTEFGFKLLPLYDIRTKFKTTPTSTLFDQNQDLALRHKLNKIDLEERQREKERILWKLEKQRKFEEARKKILEGIYGEDEKKWPAKLSDAAVEVNRKTEEATTVRNHIRNSFKSLPNFEIRNRFVNENESPKFTFTVHPILALPNQSQKVFQEESPKGACRHQTDQGEEIGPPRRPCSKKTSEPNDQNRFVQIAAYTEKPAQVKQPSVHDVNIPHSTRNTADYTQFLAPPSATIYQKFKKLSSNAQRSSVRPTPTRRVAISYEQPKVENFSSVSPSRSLPFRVFKNKLDQSVLDSLKNGRNGKVDTSKLDELTQTILVEPVNKNDHSIRKVLLTLDSAAKTFDLVDNEDKESAVFSTYGLPSKFFEPPKSNSTSDVATVISGGRRKTYFGVGDFPLDKHQIWDSENRVFIDSYGEESNIRN